MPTETSHLEREEKARWPRQPAGWGKGIAYRISAKRLGDSRQVLERDRGLLLQGEACA